MIWFCWKDLNIDVDLFSLPMSRRRIPNGVEKDFRVVLPKRLLMDMRRLIREGVYRSYAEIIREGIKLVVEKSKPRRVNTTSTAPPPMTNMPSTTAYPSLMSVSTTVSQSWLEVDEDG